MRQHQRLLSVVTLLGLLFITQAVVLAQGMVLNGFSVSYSGRVFNNATNRTTFTYTVAGTNVPPDLSHFDIEIPTCETPLEAVAYSPAQAVSFGVDPTTGVNGIKWDLPLGMNQTRVYSISFAGNVSEGTVTAAVKGGNGFEAGAVPGPSCTQVGLQVVKSVSVDGGGTWNDSEIPTGPVVAVGAPVSFMFQITNTGDFPLENVTLTDSMYDVSSCGAIGALQPAGVFECVIGPVPAAEGQHVNIATATGVYNGTTFTDTDAAHYFAGTLPKLTVEKLVGLSGTSTWYAADSAPGLIVSKDDMVSFRFVISNEGTETFTGITLADSKFSAAGCQIPAELKPAESFECVIGPFGLDSSDAQVNTLTVTAVANGQTITVTDAAHYQRDADDDTDVIVVIEGPVQVVINNIIVIYDIEIQLQPNDPLLTVIKVGDVVRVEGSISDDDDDHTTIIVIAVIVVVIDVDIYVVDNQVWRDDGECANPPPPWAPAHGWRRKCGGGGNVIIIQGGNGRGRGSGKGSGSKKSS